MKQPSSPLAQWELRTYFRTHRDAILGYTAKMSAAPVQVWLDAQEQVLSELLDAELTLKQTPLVEHPFKYLVQCLLNAIVDVLDDRERETTREKREARKATRRRSIKEWESAMRQPAEETLRQIVRKAVEELPLKERAVIELYFWEDLPLGRTAETLGFGYQQAADLGRAARARLRLALQSLPEVQAWCRAHGGRRKSDEFDRECAI